MSHVAHMKEHVTLINHSRHTYEWVMSHIWLRLVTQMSHVTHMNESQIRSFKVSSLITAVCNSSNTYEGVMPHIWMSHVTYTAESCYIYSCRRFEHLESLWSSQSYTPTNAFSWWVLQQCTGFARLVWSRLRVHRAFVYSDWFVCYVCFSQENRACHIELRRA